MNIAVIKEKLNAEFEEIKKIYIKAYESIKKTLDVLLKVTFQNSTQN